MTTPFPRRTALSALTCALGLTLALVTIPPGSAAPPAAPDRIDLPDGWQPEGITTDGRRLYAGSLADGRILRADPRTGTVHVLPASRTGTPAVGIDHDAERRVLWVAGGPAGEIRAHGVDSGRLLGRYPLPADVEGRFVNDLVVTDDAVYATDSQNAELGVVRLDGRAVPPSGPAEVLPVGGDFELAAGFNLNGIVESGSWLLAVQSATGTLWRIDPAGGDATAVDLGGYALTFGDGLEPDGDLLHVVRNRANLIATLALSPDRASGALVAETTSPDFDVPTTAALLDGSLWAVNARFGNPAPAEASYWITRVPAPRG